MDVFDFVIIGAGTAGCALAFRLSAKGHSVCVLEAGPPDSNPLIRIPSGILKTSVDPNLTWQYQMQGNANVLDRSLPTFFGKTVGGSGAINGMIYNRGQKGDFDDWAADGCDGWDYASVLPYFKRSETYLSECNPAYRGTSGPVRVKMLEKRDPCTDRFIRACIEAGMAQVSDYNGPDQEGVSYVQAKIYRGKRQFNADAYLHPARRRFGVDLRTNALVERIAVNEGRANGVYYRPSPGVPSRYVQARREVLLCAGAIMSPKLLQLSGIGPSSLLSQLGISVVRDLPAGLNLSDHYSVRLVARARAGHRTLNELVRFPHNVIEGIRWLAGRPSILALTSMTGCTFNRINPDDRDTSYSMFFLPAALKAGMTRRLDEFPGLTGGTWQQRPHSRGHVIIKSTDINEAPLIYPNYLDAEIDRKVLIHAIRHLREVFRAEPLREIITELTLPAQECRTDDEWLDYIRGYGMTSYHPAGTCRMGAADDPRSVVDPRLRVIGVDRLRVVDASVMPTQPSGNLNAGVMMIAEKASDMILEDAA